MRKLIWVCLLPLSILVLILSIDKAFSKESKGIQQEYARIWTEGYIDGWCVKEDGYCIEPIPPIPPMQRIEDSTYRVIYHKGFVRGMNDNN
jgi:hypothetical protein